MPESSIALHKIGSRDETVDVVNKVARRATIKIGGLGEVNLESSSEESGSDSIINLSIDDSKEAMIGEKLYAIDDIGKFNNPESQLLSAHSKPSYYGDSPQAKLPGDSFFKR